MENGSVRDAKKNDGTIMSKNAGFDNVLSIVFGTLDSVHQLHAPERLEDDSDPGNCVNCEVAFPCKTEEVILEGLAHVQLAMDAAAEAASENVIVLQEKIDLED